VAARFEGDLVEVEIEGIGRLANRIGGVYPHAQRSLADALS
jgi:hypothetical protein